MKNQITLFFLFFTILTFAQNNVLVIQKIDSERSIEIKEHKRIKLETKDGQKMFGRFTVVDSSSIMIQEKIILLEDIVKLKRKSLASTIVNPVLIVYGSVFIITGASIIGGTGIFDTFFGGSLIVVGTPLVLIPLLSNKHPSNAWKYSIKINKL